MKDNPMRRFLTLAVVLAFGFGVEAQDFSNPVGTSDNDQSPDAGTLERGRLIAAGGAQQGGVEMKCMACHGRSGQGGGAAPMLAGLPWSYLADQLVAYRKGTRKSRIMSEVASRLTASEIRAVTAWYASKSPSSDAADPEADTRLLERGGALARAGLRSGSASAEMTACVMCHGQDAMESGTAVPPLAGQSADYIASQLRAWQNGTRHNDPLNVMREIAEQLSADDIEAVAAYYANLPPQPDEE